MHFGFLTFVRPALGVAPIFGVAADVSLNNVMLCFADLGVVVVI